MAVLTMLTYQVLLLVGCISKDDFVTALAESWFQAPPQVMNSPPSPRSRSVSLDVPIMSDVPLPPPQNSIVKDRDIVAPGQQMLKLHGIDKSFLRSAGSEFTIQCMKGSKENFECFVADPKPLIVNLAGSSGTGRVGPKPPPPPPQPKTPVRVGPLLQSTERVCILEHKLTQIKCSTGRISVKSALYGRKSGVKCNDRDRHVSSRPNCAAKGVLEKVQERCDDERSCELTATNRVYGDPCGGVVKYLDVHYSCE